MNWPSFSFPFGGWFFLSLIPLVVLYFLKLKRPKLEIPSLALWQSVVNDQRVNSPFQKFRRNLLLLLQLILLCLVILALMQPFITAGPEKEDYLPILIDCSASMLATVEGEDQTRLDQAKEQIREISGNGKIGLYAFSNTGRRLTEFTDDRRILNRALDRLEGTHRVSRLDEVLRMVGAVARTLPVQRAIVFTDGNLKEHVDVELPFALEIRRVDEGGDNLGITEMNARRSGTDSWDVFVRVAGSTSEPAYGELKLTQDGKVVGREPVVASNQDSERVVFSVGSNGSSLLQATLKVDGFDSLDVDNTVWLNLPETRPLRIRTSADLFSWQHALNVQSDLDVDSGELPSTPSYDLIITDSYDLGGAAAPIVIYSGVVPEELKDLIAVSDVDVDETPVRIVDWVKTTPLLRHVQLRDVQIGQKARFAAGADAHDLEERGFEVLVHGAEGPLMLQRRRGLETEYYFLFHTDRSTLPYRVAFPILVTNVIETAMQQASLSEVVAAPTGVLPALNVAADREYVVQGPTGESDTVRSTASGLLTGIQADVVGKYNITDAGISVASVGTGLLSPLETSLRAVDELQFTELNVATSESQIIDSDRHLWWPLALMAFVFLLAEWWYFQRMKTGAVA
ncbi:MAG: BatA and WFA domain-containing protein [Fuerstiella sp.]|nr:BatA and WFA domain-containing protein [Fuerstiella sp.]